MAASVVGEPAWPEEAGASPVGPRLVTAVSDDTAEGTMHLLLVATGQKAARRAAALLANVASVECSVAEDTDPTRLGRAARECDALVLAVDKPDDAARNLVAELSHGLPKLPLVVFADAIDDSDALALVRHGAQECLDAAAFQEGRAGTTLDRVIERHRRVRRQQERETQRAVSAAASGVLDRLPLGVMMIDGRGQVVMTNAKARAIIAAGDGLMIDPSSGSFRAEKPEETKALLDLVKRTIAGEVEAEDSCALTISRPSMRQSICVMVTPLVARSRTSPEGRAGVAIFLSDPEDRIDIDEDVLRGLYGLTRVEARLALGLVRGRQLDEMAEETKVSVHTVRSQLKQIFRKTDTNRQADVVKLLLTGPAAIRVQLDT